MPDERVDVAEPLVDAGSSSDRLFIRSPPGSATARGRPGSTRPAATRPSTAAPRMAAYSCDGSPVAVCAYSMINLPMPPRVPVEISATIAPTTAAAAASRTAGMIAGTAARAAAAAAAWSTSPRASDVNSSTDARPGPASPRSAPTAMGKNARYDAITMTLAHGCHAHPMIAILPPQPATSGAIAISGTVCDATM